MVDSTRTARTDALLSCLPQLRAMVSQAHLDLKDSWCVFLGKGNIPRWPFSFPTAYRLGVIAHHFVFSVLLIYRSRTRAYTTLSKRQAICSFLFREICAEIETSFYSPLLTLTRCYKSDGVDKSTVPAILGDWRRAAFAVGFMSCVLADDLYSLACVRLGTL